VRYKLNSDDKALANNPAGLTNREKEIRRAKAAARKAARKSTKKKKDTQRKEAKKAIQSAEKSATTGTLKGSGSKTKTAYDRYRRETKA
tara:strand:- start:2583 stop:2849 length:267 start_codon:yes stop_codon:yes gene_type:complete